MRVAAGQFAVTPVWRTNAQTCVAMMQQAEREGAALLVLPEALLARDDNDPDLSVKSAQPLDGAFLQPLLAESRRNSLTTVLDAPCAVRGGESDQHVGGIAGRRSDRPLS
ncbi:amidase [Klebsiella pneumoniae]|uniref:Amidase n=1 Tax=Klebsiella pneumoniae TaxID=573 RepID=A0A377V1P1_KLEPN|nr:amidase [Klebsiella pneumoniae]